MLLAELASLPPGPLCVAFSGGLDSTVLLHLLVRSADAHRRPLRAVHVDHAIHPDSTRWSQHCRSFAATLAVPVSVLPIEVANDSKFGLEAAARQARYRALSEQLGVDELLLTAHHQDDQAETLILQLLRGGGVHGLASMGRCRRFSSGWLARPLLDVTRSALNEYAGDEGLTWIDDPSNFDVGFERNFIRHEFLPLLATRHPSVSRVLARSAGHFAESAELLDELAAADLQMARGDDGSLAIANLAALTPARRHNLVRYWLRQQGLMVPQSQQMASLEQTLFNARDDAQPVERWPGTELRRFRGRLYAMSPLRLPPSEFALTWDGLTPLELPGSAGRLAVERGEGGGISKQRWRGHIEVRFRQGGESLRPAGRGHRHAVKKLLQEAGVPPWERQLMPLISVDGELAQVGGQWIDEAFAASTDEESVRIVWRH